MQNFKTSSCTFLHQFTDKHIEIKKLTNPFKTVESIRDRIRA